MACPSCGVFPWESSLFLFVPLEGRLLPGGEISRTHGELFLDVLLCIVVALSIIPVVVIWVGILSKKKLA